MIDDALLAFAGRLADAAGAAIRPYFRQRFEIETKDDASPVTAADRAAEDAIRTILEAERPADGIVGEEYGSVREAARHVWVLDPIDGTRAFVAGRPLFGTLIALMEDGVPVLGVIDQPIIGDRWLGARGRATTFNGAPCRTRACPSLGAARVGTTSPQAFDAATFAAFERLRPHTLDTLYGGDCHNYGLLASGHLDLVVEAGLKIHDFAALVPVVEGAGGVMRDWSGAPLTASSDGRVVASGDPALVDAVVALLR
jgi:histidinol phosphatase-like enzyme (inositol monophosphatase family)